MKPIKTSKMLPNRAAMNQLGKSNKSILDYAKATPLAPQQAGPNMIANLVTSKGKNA